MCLTCMLQLSLARPSQTLQPQIPTGLAALLATLRGSSVVSRLLDICGAAYVACVCVCVSFCVRVCALVFVHAHRRQQLKSICAWTFLWFGGVVSCCCSGMFATQPLVVPVVHRHSAGSAMPRGHGWASGGWSVMWFGLRWSLAFHGPPECQAAGALSLSARCVFLSWGGASAFRAATLGSDAQLVVPGVLALTPPPLRHRNRGHSIDISATPKGAIFIPHGYPVFG